VRLGEQRVRWFMAVDLYIVEYVCRDVHLTIFLYKTDKPPRAAFAITLNKYWQLELS